MSRMMHSQRAVSLLAKNPSQNSPVLTSFKRKIDNFRPNFINFRPVSTLNFAKSLLNYAPNRIWRMESGFCKRSYCSEDTFINRRSFDKFDDDDVESIAPAKMRFRSRPPVVNVEAERRNPPKINDENDLVDENCRKSYTRFKNAFSNDHSFSERRKFSKILLLQVPRCALLEQDADGFVSLFSKWWPFVYNFLNGLTPEEVIDLLACFGKLNVASNGRLRRVLTPQHLQILEKQLLSDSDVISSRSSNVALYLAYKRLAIPGDFYASYQQRFPGIDQISKLLRWHESSMGRSDYELSMLINALSAISIFPQPADLRFIIDQFVRFFDSNISANANDNLRRRVVDIRSLHSLTDTHWQVARAFFTWRLNPDRVQPDFWRKYFLSAEYVLKMLLSRSDEEIISAHKKTGGQSTTTALLFCADCFDVASEFEKFDEFSNVKILLIDLLAKRLTYGKLYVRALVHRSVQSCETAYQMRQHLLLENDKNWSKDFSGRRRFITLKDIDAFTNVKDKQ